ncbi:hypothetical protein J1C49_20760 [Cognatishimia sp. F0-27]|nr:hypothetical protein [Cognatishimia sp. F0-27]
MAKSSGFLAFVFCHIVPEQAGIDGEDMTTDAPFRDAARYSRLEHMAEQIACTETAMSGLRDRRMGKNSISQIEMAKPPIRRVQRHLSAEPSLAPEAKTRPTPQHPDQPLKADGRRASVAEKLRQIGSDAVRTDDPIKQAQKAILQNKVFERQRVKQRRPH